MNAQLTINGQTISIELTQEQIEQLTKKKPVKKWEDLGKVKGWCIDIDSDIFEAEESSDNNENRNIYATENQARSALAMAQLSQLMKNVNGEWKPAWAGNTNNYCINQFKDRIYCDIYTNACTFLSFPTAEIRNEFLENHRSLIEEYFLMYK